MAGSGRDLHTQLGLAQSAPPAARTNGTVNGTAVDLAGCHQAVVVFVAGTITDGSHAISVEDSDDGSTGWAAATVEGALSSPLVGADDNVIRECSYAGAKRFIRPVIVTSGATTGGVIGAHVVKGGARSLPV